MRRPRLTLAGSLVAVALAALALSVATPRLRRAFGNPNSWVVRTVTLPDGTIVRRRIRRHPDRDVIHEEILAPPASPRPDWRPGRGRSILEGDVRPILAPSGGSPLVDR